MTSTLKADAVLDMAPEYEFSALGLLVVLSVAAIALLRWILRRSGSKKD